MSCHVTGIFRTPAGEPVEGATIYISAAGIAASADGAALPLMVTATTGTGGSLALDLLPGRYTLTWVGRGHPYTAPLSVPDEPTAALEDLLVAAPAPVRGPPGKGWSGGHYDAATGRVVFESNDGLEFQTDDLRGSIGVPAGAPGQLIAFAAEGGLAAVDPPALPVLASVPEAAAGSSEELRSWSPLRVAQAAQAVTDTVQGRLVGGVLQLRFGTGTWISIVETETETPPVEEPEPSAPELVTGGSLPAGALYSDQQLSLTPPVYDGVPTPTLELEWQWSSDGDTWTPLEETEATLTLTEGLEGASIRVRYRASNSEGTSAWGTTNTVGPVLAPLPVPAAPVLVSAGSLPSGALYSDQQLTLTPPVYGGVPTPTLELEWQWSSDGETWTPLEETGATLTLSETLEGASIRLRYRASNSEGTSAWGTTNTVGPVLAPLPVPSAPELVSAGSLPSGALYSDQQLALTPPVYDGVPTPTLELEWQWSSDGETWTPLEETGATLTLSETLEGASIRLRYRASNSEGTSAWGTTNTVGPVLAPPLQLTANGLSISVDGVLAHGLTEDGVRWVKIDPEAGATVTALGQSFRQGADGKMLDGTVLNPVRDGAHSFHESAWGYNAAAQVSLPLAVQPGDVLITSDGRESINLAAPANADARKGAVLAYGSFIFVEDAPAAGAFAPSPMGWTGRTRGEVLDGFEVVDLDTVVAALPELDLSSVSGGRAVATLIEGLAAHNPLFAGSFKDTTNGYETLFPYGFGNIEDSNYGVQTASVINDAALHLVGDVATTAEKKALLRALVTLGKTAWEVSSGGGGKGGAAGHWQFHQLPALAYLYATGQDDEYANLAAVVPGNLFDMIFQWDATLLAQQVPHDNPDWLHTWRRRVIPEDGVSGNVITLPAYTGGANSDPGKVDPGGIVLVRESDGAEAVPVAASWPDSDYRYTIDAQPDPAFAPGDTIYMRSTYGYFAGDPDWRISGRPSHYHPSAGFAYRDSQNPAAFVLFARALGIRDESWTALERLAARGVAADDPLADNDFPPLSYQHPMGASFWAAHAAALGIAPWDPWVAESAGDGAALVVRRAGAGSAPVASGGAGKIVVTG